MKRRILVELELVDTIPGGVFDVLVALAGELERLKNEDLLVDYGIGLEHDVTWLIQFPLGKISKEEETRVES